MSLRPDFRHYAPDDKAYAHREMIPENERCEHCDGLGSVRFMYSGCFGNVDPRGSKDWCSCWACDGSGRKPDEEE